MERYSQKGRRYLERLDRASGPTDNASGMNGSSSMTDKVFAESLSVAAWGLLQPLSIRIMSGYGMLNWRSS
jgi:hypothetical protein